MKSIIIFVLIFLSLGNVFAQGLPKITVAYGVDGDDWEYDEHRYRRYTPWGDLDYDVRVDTTINDTTLILDYSITETGNGWVHTEQAQLTTDGMGNYDTTKVTVSLIDNYGNPRKQYTYSADGMGGETLNRNSQRRAYSYTPSSTCDSILTRYWIDRWDTTGGNPRWTPIDRRVFTYTTQSPIHRNYRLDSTWSDTDLKVVPEGELVVNFDPTASIPLETIYNDIDAMGNVVPNRRRFIYVRNQYLSGAGLTEMLCDLNTQEDGWEEIAENYADSAFLETYNTTTMQWEKRRRDVFIAQPRGGVIVTYQMYDLNTNEYFNSVQQERYFTFFGLLQRRANFLWNDVDSAYRYTSGFNYEYTLDGDSNVLELQTFRYEPDTLTYVRWFRQVYRDFHHVREDTTNSINTYATAQQLVQVYPNPAKGEVNIQWKTTIAGPVTIELLDLNGSVKLTETHAIHQGQVIHLKEGLQHCATGLYFLRIKTAERTVVERLLVE